MIFFYQFQTNKKIDYNIRIVLHDNIDMMNIFDKNPDDDDLLQEISEKLNKNFSQLI